MKFSQFLSQNVKSILWKEASRNGNSKITAYLKNNEKQIFFDTVMAYSEKFGVDSLLSEKSNIIHYAKIHNIKKIEITRLIYNILGEKTATIFNKRNYFQPILIIVLMIMSFVAGGLFFPS